MKVYIQQLIEETIEILVRKGALASGTELKVQVDRTKDKAHGDLTTNLAMIMAKSAKRNPRQLAAEIIAHLPSSELVQKVEIAGPGFINFFLNEDWLAKQIDKILADP